jgi:hypothetical protein
MVQFFQSYQIWSSTAMTVMRGLHCDTLQDALMNASAILVMVLAYLTSRRRLVRGEAPSLSVGGAPDCCRNR